MTRGTCNGCGENQALTKEHLISLPIGRVIVKRNDVDTTSMRRLLATDNVRVKNIESHDAQPIANTRLDGYIENLLCANCNQGWAIALEEVVGPLLYDFVHLRGRLSDTKTLKRWMAFFSVKGAFYYDRTEWLATDGPYQPLLGIVADPMKEVEFQLLVARLDVSPRNWRFGFGADPLLGEWPVMLWIHFWGVLFVLADPGTKPPVRMTVASDGVRYVDTAVLRKRELAKVMPPKSIETLARTNHD